MTVCGAGNDHRLGAHEAPPAIISVFLGEQLTDILRQLQTGSARRSKDGGHLEIGVSMLPKLPRDAGDRNRTSPFAFTGNKFEFRAVGSSQSIAGPVTVLNAIVAESLDYVATRLEQAVSKGTELNQAVTEVLSEMIREFRPVLFDGDNYSKEWQEEAHRRGLPDLRNTPDTVPLAISDEAIALFTKYKVYTERELRSRYEILLTNYTKAVGIEGQTALVMGRTMILPAALRYQTDVAAAVASAKQGGLPAELQAALLEELVSAINSFQQALAELEAALDGPPEGDVLAQAVYQRDRVLVAMAEVRRWGDRLETRVHDALWPLPAYREMLFIR